MNKEEKKVLQKVLDCERGLLSQSVILSYLPNQNTKISHSLIISGLIEEVKRKGKITKEEATYYRITEKGKIIFAPLHKRIWYFIKGDVRTIIVAIITSLIITIITLILFK